MSWTNEDTFKFINLYQNESIIWDPNNEQYKDRCRVSDAWERISVAMEIPVRELKKKKETLMTAFRLHYKKKQHSLRTATGEDDVYKPSWIFYDAMEAFLNVIYETKVFVNTEDNVSTSPRQETSDDEESLQHERDDAAEKRKKRKIPVRKRRRTCIAKQQETPEQTPKTTLNPILKHEPYDDHVKQEPMNNLIDEDDCELFGKLLAKKLRQFSYTDRQEIMYEIDGLLLNRRHFLLS